MINREEIEIIEIIEKIINKNKTERFLYVVLLICVQYFVLRFVNFRFLFFSGNPYQPIVERKKCGGQDEEYRAAPNHSRKP